MNAKILLSLVLVLCVSTSNAQQADELFSVSETRRIESVLAADDMMGRAPFTPGIDKAADFIAEEFKQSGIQPLQGQSYFQDFYMVWTEPLAGAVTVNGNAIKNKNYFVIAAKKEVSVSNPADYQLVKVNATDNLDSVINELQKTDNTYLLQVDNEHRAAFKRREASTAGFFYTDATIIAVLYTGNIEACEVNYSQAMVIKPFKNVAGVLPGRSKKNEVVIFSAHYDHVGVGKPDLANDSIFNGANDDASGTTAVIMLARYFAQRNDNERTLVFVAFTAEETGGYGSQYFSRQQNPDSVVAMFNIEMIGTDSKWGLNAAYITGYELTDMGRILQQNLAGSEFTFHADPYPEEHLFFRSDNATLAKLGVPAHTISTSKMDTEQFYHTRYDEVKTLNLENMTEIIKAIALSSQTIVAGKDTPKRVRKGM